jgi:hypothetical protein
LAFVDEHRDGVVTTLRSAQHDPDARRLLAPEIRSCSMLSTMTRLTCKPHGLRTTTHENCSLSPTCSDGPTADLSRPIVCWFSFRMAATSATVRNSSSTSGSRRSPDLTSEIV